MQENNKLNMTAVNYYNQEKSDNINIKSKSPVEKTVDEQKSETEINSINNELKKEKKNIKKKRKFLLIIWVAIMITIVIIIVIGVSFFNQKKAAITESEAMQNTLEHTEQVANLVEELDYNEVKNDLKKSMTVEANSIDEKTESTFDDSEEAFLHQTEQKELIKKVFPQDIVPVYFEAQIKDFRYDNQGNFYKVKSTFLPEKFNEITNFYKEELDIEVESYKSEKIETETFKGLKDQWFFTVYLEIKPKAKIGILEITLSKKN